MVDFKLLDAFVSSCIMLIVIYLWIVYGSSAVGRKTLKDKVDKIRNRIKEFFSDEPTP